MLVFKDYEVSLLTNWQIFVGRIYYYFSYLMGLEKMALSYDEAKLEIISYFQQTLSIWTQSEECYECYLQYKSQVTPYNNASIILNTAHNILLELRNKTDHVVCSKTLSLNEHGVYSMNLTRKDLCPSLITLHEPDQIYNALYFVIGLYLTFLGIWFFGKILYKAQWMHKLFGNNPIITEIENDLGSPNSSGDNVTLLRYTSQSSPTHQSNTSSQISRTRVRGLDVLRGISIVLMIFVNYGGGKYALFEHSAWNGITIADFIFPWFVWIMGVSLTFSLCSKLRSGSTRAQLFLDVLKRSFYLIIFGLIIVNWGNRNLGTLRYTGVLQRLGIAYFFVGAVETFLMRTQPIFTYDPHGQLYHIRDLIESWPQWLFTFVTIALHTCITFFLKVPNCPEGYLGPGGYADYESHVNCTGGAAGYIDRIILGPNHMYANPTCKKIYGTKIPFDPEGLLGTLTTIALMYLGVYAGRVMLCFPNTGDRIKRWLITAISFGLIGGFLCNFSQEGGLIPLNKNLWSLSFVLVTAASSSVLMSLFLLCVDHYKLWSGSPFHQAGKNAIFIYIGHIITRNQLPWSWEITHTNSHIEYTIMHAWGSILWLLIALFMFEKKCFFTI